MSHESFWEGNEKRESLTGLTVSVVLHIAMALFFWMVGSFATQGALSPLSEIQYISGAILGSIIGTGELALNANPTLKERWRSSLKSRLTFGIPIAISIGFLMLYNPAIVSVGMAVVAVVFTVGRTYLYLTA